MSREINVVPAQKFRPPKPSANASRALEGFPRESASDASSAKGRQREILEKELATEQSALARAKQDLFEQQTLRAGEGRLQSTQDNIETHEKNIEALKRELSNLR